MIKMLARPSESLQENWGINDVSIELPTGCIVAIADLTNCERMIDNQVETIHQPKTVAIQNQTELEQAVGDWQPGRYAWKLENTVALPEPIPYKGKQGLWVPSAELIEKLGGAA